MLKKFKFFDVTLRDGLQSISKIYTLNEKKDIFHNILKKNPSFIEIGSIVSNKVLPQMENSIELYNYANDYIKKSKQKPDLYMLIPNLKNLKIAHDNNIKNFSFITSTSDLFQKKNINKSLNKTKQELSEMINYSIKNINNSKNKLYISCISECPIAGKIENEFITNEILYYHYTHEKTINQICLSDTCGTLKFLDFKIIIDNLIRRNVNLEKISLHLHNHNNNNNLNTIIIYAIKNGILRFDVSTLPNLGGCSVTMDKTNGNISYENVTKIYDTYFNV